MEEAVPVGRFPQLIPSEGDLGSLVDPLVLSDAAVLQRDDASLFELSERGSEPIPIGHGRPGALFLCPLRESRRDGFAHQAASPRGNLGELSDTGWELEHVPHRPEEMEVERFVVVEASGDQGVDFFQDTVGERHERCLPPRAAGDHPRPTPPSTGWRGAQGVYSSAGTTAPPLLAPPATSTLPLGSSVAVWILRGADMKWVVLQVRVAGS